jgi:hypothetical protein
MHADVNFGSLFFNSALTLLIAKRNLKFISCESFILDTRKCLTEIHYKTNPHLTWFSRAKGLVACLAASRFRLNKLFKNSDYCYILVTDEASGFPPYSNAKKKRQMVCTTRLPEPLFFIFEATLTFL